MLFLIIDFNLLSCELQNFLRLMWYLDSFYKEIILKQNKIIILSQFPMKNLKWFLFAFSTMEHVAFAFLCQARFPVVKLIYYIDFGSASSACYLLKTISIIL